MNSIYFNDYEQGTDPSDMTAALTQSKRNINLILELSITQFKLKYAGSILGYLWSLIKPLMIFATMYIIFAKLFHIGKGTPDFPFQLLVAIVIWNFFGDTTGQTMNAIVANGSLVQKTYFPRWILVIATTISSLMTFVINMILVLIVGLFLHTIHPVWQSFLVPFFCFELYLFAIGLSLFLSALYVQFRDVGHVWEWFSQLLFYGSAVVYPITYIPNHVVQTIIAINPITQVIEDVRYSIVTQSIEPLNHLLGNLYIVPYIFVAISILVGSFVFSRLSSHFAENL